jgi:uncharacterized membrane protein (UPF0182 family)
VAADTRIAQLVREASDRYEQATAAQRVGDWATYGEQMRRVGELLRELQGLVPAGRHE